MNQSIVSLFPVRVAVRAWDHLQGLETRRRTYVLGVSALFAVSLAAAAGVSTTQLVSTTPRVCLSCHGTGETLNVSMASHAHPDYGQVGCVECHAKKAGLLPILRGGYSADPQVVSRNCQRCHEDIPTRGERISKLGAAPVQFSHEEHVTKLSLECTECHSTLSHSRDPKSTNLPTHDSCFGCHEKDQHTCATCHPKGSPPPPRTETINRADCANCHQDFSTKQLTIFGRSYRHGPHLESGLDCALCHSNAKKHGEIRLTSDSCDGCHRVEKPTSHTSGWRKEHGAEALTAGAECSTCHDATSFCEKCHGLTIPHEAGWQNTHGAVAASQSKTCLQCHTTQDCQSCHSKTKPESHQRDWTKQHGAAAQRASAECSVCHSQETCAACHSTEMPHPKDWLSGGHQQAARATENTCARCHDSKESCAKCHGVDLPHPSDWVLTHKEKASFRSEAVCFRCHTYTSKCAQCHGETPPE